MKTVFCWKIDKNLNSSTCSSKEKPFDLFYKQLRISFIHSKKNLFSLSKTTPTCLDKGNPFIFHFFSSSSSLSIIAVTVIGTTVAENDAVDAAIATGDVAVIDTIEAAAVVEEVDDQTTAATTED